MIIDGKDVFKYPVIGKMTSANVAGACKAAGMKPTCYDDSVPEYQDSNCVQLSGNIFIEIQKILCPDPDWTTAYTCQPLQNVFVYMKKHNTWGEGGKETCGNINHFCKNGRDYSNKYTLCVFDNVKPPGIASQLHI